MTRRRVEIVGGCALVMILCAAAAERSLAEKDQQFDTVKREDLVVGVEVRGTLFAEESDTITPPSLSDVWRFQISNLATEGSDVKKGDPVVSFDTQELTRSLQEEQAERDSAKKQIEKRRADLKLERETESLALEEARARYRKSELKVQTPESIISVKELEQARADYSIAAREIQHLQKRLDSIQRAADEELTLLQGKLMRSENRVTDLQKSIDAMNVRAPRAGIVVYVTGWMGEKKKVGDNAWRGEPLVEIPNLARMKARGEIDEAEAGRIASGQSVSIRLDAHADSEFRGTIARVGDSVRPESRTVPLKVLPIEIKLAKPDPAIMKPGMRFRGTVELERIAGAVVVPLDAIFDASDGPVVYRKGLLRTTPVSVRLGRRNREKAEVLDGLKPGDLVAVRQESSDEGRR